jgi:hypothetical protein
MRRWQGTTILAGCAFSAWALSAALATWPVSGANDIVRLILLAVAAGVTTATLRRPTQRALLSPPLLMGLLVFVFYGLAPAIYVLAFDAPPSYFVRFGTGGHDAAVRFVGSHGERLLLQFAGLCFFLAALVLRTAPAAVPAAPYERLRWIGTFAAPAAALLTGAVYLLIGQSPAVAAFMSAGIGAEIKHAMAPVMAICLATLAAIAGGAGRRHVLAAATVIIAALAMMATSGLAETPIYITIVSVLLLVAVRGLNALALAGTAAGLTAVLFATLAAIALVRPSTALHVSDSAGRLEAVVYAKLIHRQAVSAACLDRIAERFAGSEERNPLYFLMAPVPRAIWPEKPNLSRGHEFAVRYCGQGENVDPRHSESITLLGEPLLAAGTPGLIAAQAFVAVLLFGAALFGLSGGTVRLITMAAMLPWLLMFGQHFAQYVANLMKMSVIMLPFVGLLVWAAKPRTSRIVAEETPADG